jgi:hypothetical protein
VDDSHEEAHFINGCDAGSLSIAGRPQYVGKGKAPPPVVTKG